MYEKDGEKYYIVDEHVHLWDGRDSNCKNIHGNQFIECFYDYHRNLSPAEEVWDFDAFTNYGADKLMKDLFEDGYVDHAIFQATILRDFYKNGFAQVDDTWDLVQKNPERLTYNHAYDPRDGEDGLKQFEKDVEKYGLQGVKLYTAEWHGDSRGYKLDEYWSRRYLDKCQELGVKNIHVHKGPTIRPLDRDAFDVADIDKVATDYLDLNFIVEHCGLPRLEDFCWIATQESNVYGGLAVAIPFMHTRPRYFAQVIGELLYWIGEDKILFASDYALWTPKWLIERFVDFQIPEDMTEYAPITTDQKKKILGLNAAALYNLDVPEHLRLPTEAGNAVEDAAVGAKAATAGV